MDLFSKPFSAKRENKQLTPDLGYPEKPVSPDVSREPGQEKPEKDAQDTKTLDRVSAEKDLPGPKPAPTPTPSPAAKSATLKNIENILQEDLEDIFFNMDQAHRRMFKAEGERTSLQIEKVLSLGKSVTVKVLELIQKWLRLIPGVNKFFIEQEAKIKTDKIIKLNKS